MKLRILLAIVSLASAGSSLAVTPTELGGTWRDTWCGPRQPRDMCGMIELTLVQDGAQLCGQFAAQSSGGEKVDGGPVVGVAMGRSAVVTLTSQLRDNSIWLGRLDLMPDRLRWHKLDMVKDADPDRQGLSDAIPRRAELGPINIQPPGKAECP